MKKNLTILLFLTLTTLLHAKTVFPENADAAGTKTYSVHGFVKDNSGIPLPYAQVTIKGTTKGVVTDGDGSYYINSLTNGEYTFCAAFLGYNNSENIVNIDESDVELNFIMEEDSKSVDDIVVYGALTRGQAKALTSQKNDLRIINVVDYEQFAKFPDRNTAEALQRIPGVSITKDQGEGEFVMIRGMSPEYNSVQLNGQRIPSPDKDDARGTGMGLLLADMMQSIVIYKTMSPDMDGDAIGGTVDFNLKEAPDKRYLSLSLQGGYNAQHTKFNHWGKDVQHGSFMFGDRFFKNNKLGVLLSGSYDRNNIGSILNQYTYVDDTKNIQDKRWNDYDVKRTRYGLIFSPDFRFNGRNKIRLVYTYNQFDDDEVRRRADYLMTDPEKSTLRRETRNRIEKVNTSMLQLSGEHYIGTLKIDYVLANIHSNMDEPDQSNYRYEAKNVDLSMLTNDQKYNLTGISKLLPSDKELKLSRVTTAYEKMKDRDNSAKINFSVPFNMLGRTSRLKAGAKWLKKKKNYTMDSYTGTIDNNGSNLTIEDGQFGLTGIKTENSKGRVPVTDYKKDNEINSASYDASEEITSAYIMGEFKFTKNLAAVAGVRYEHTSNKYYHLETERRGNSSYENYLPSLTLIYNLTEESNIKAAYSKGISRPAYSKMVPYYSVDEQSLKIKEGNPNLKPSYADSYDLLYEHYTNNLGMFTAGVFYKRLHDKVNSSVEYIYIDNDRYEYTKPVNMGTAKVCGAELAVNKRFRNSSFSLIKYAGIYANYTFTKSESKYDGRKIALGSSPEHVANISLFFDHEKSGWSFSFTNVFRSAILNSIGSDKVNDEYFGKQFHMDFAISKRICKGTTLNLQINNITDEPEREYLGDPSSSKYRLQQTEYYGRRYTLGVLWKL